MFEYTPRFHAEREEALPIPTTLQNLSSTANTVTQSSRYRKLISRVGLILYGLALAAYPLFGYLSIPLFCSMVVLVLVAVALGVRVRTLAIITVAGFLAAVAMLALKPYPKGPDGLIPIIRHLHSNPNP